MSEKLIEWANAGDANAAYLLAQFCKNFFFESEYVDSEYIKWLEKAAEGKDFQGMKELAKILREHEELRDTEKAFQIYKELVTEFHDVESMEILVDMCDPSDTETLNLILDTIDKEYNQIYVSDSILQRIVEFGTRRHDELTIQTFYAIERRRIAARIKRILKGAN